jgi:ubiquinone/menaquinone biosynthesis C-methylase UbiE
MNNNIDIVKNHFSNDIFIKEMVDRNNLGLRNWEKLVTKNYFGKNGNKILDIGCGTGREAIALAKLGYKITGIDISEEEIEIAKNEAQKEQLEIEFKICNGINLEFDNDTFDYSIIWAQTFGNVYAKKDRIKILLENKRVLRNDGILCFSTHDYEYVKGNYKQFTKGHRFYPYSNSKCYWKLFTVDEINNHVNEIGFKIIFLGKSKELDKNIDIDVLICICKK